MLNHAIESAVLENVLATYAEYHPFPRYAERAAWEALHPEVKAYYAGLGENLIGSAWPELRAVRYMDFARNGNRAEFETPYFQRRTQLFTLLICECIEGHGRYIDDIINGIWTVCEETSWVLPAHNNQSALIHADRFNALPDIEEEPAYIDLFSAETGSLLSWVYYLLGDRLAVESPLIPRRIQLELERRILHPYLERSDYGWMGLCHDKPVNNWNPWINSNVLTAALIMEQDSQRRCELVRKCGASSQRFLDFYAPDGGCDEGPGYFNVAGASMLDILELLHGATAGAVDIYSEPLIQNMGEYIYYTHISGEYHVNFADAAARVQPAAALLLRTGNATCRHELCNYARYALAAGYAHKPYLTGSGQLYRRITDILTYNPELYAGAPLKAARDHFFAGIQVPVARNIADSDAGLFFAAKGGANAESHNHNDIGNYVVYANGQPFIIDVGVEQYSRKTFSEHRYDIWTMQSRYHNTAIVNGCDQLPGETHTARDISYEVAGGITRFALDMAAAYAPDAGLDSYKRTFEFTRNDHGGQLAVTDAVRLNAAAKPLALPLMCGVCPELSKGHVRLSEAGTALILEYDANLFDAAVECVALTDSKLLANWRREKLYRVVLSRRQAMAEDKFTIVYSLEHN